MNGLAVITSDGSHTLYVPELKEYYHSTFGAIQESMHVFINTGFRKCTPGNDEIRILEVGFGTGLNAFLTLIGTGAEKNKVSYTAMEPYPISFEIWTELNYPERTGTGFRPLFNKIHESEWNKEIKITEFFRLQKIMKKIEDCSLPSNHFNLVYFDAFAPEVQPELWTMEIFSKLFDSMMLNGILVTYSAKGEVRRAMKEAGFIVERLPGPPGKRHITRALKKY